MTLYYEKWRLETVNDDEKKVYGLVELLKGYREEYYNRSVPSITDAQYDTLFDELSALEKKTGLYLPDSPTQCVGFEVIDKCDKIKHSVPVLSMMKTKSYDRVTEFVNNREVLFSHKIDGITIVLEYDDGHLVSASTRGNGSEGKNILSSIEGINGIPLTIAYNYKLIVIGEGFINIHNYENNKNLFWDTSGNEFIDARNFASYVIQTNNSILIRKYSINFLAFVSYTETNVFKTKEEQMEQLRVWGFAVCEYEPMKSDFSKESISAYIKKLKIKADNMSIPIDGIVITFNNINFSKSLGRTTHHYNDSLAYKF